MSEWRGDLIVVAGDGQAKLNWTTKEGDLTDHRVVLFQEDDLGPDQRIIADVTEEAGSVTVAGLTNGTPYVFRLRTFTPQYDHPMGASNSVAVVPYAVATDPLVDRERMAAVLLGAMQAMQAEDPWAFGDLREEDGYRSMWIETTGTIDLRDLADHLIKALSVSRGTVNT